jgi:hypothetical protein
MNGADFPFIRHEISWQSNHARSQPDLASIMPHCITMAHANAVFVDDRKATVLKRRNLKTYSMELAQQALFCSVLRRRR